MGCGLSSDNNLNAQLPPNRYERRDLLGAGTHGKVFRIHDKVNSQDYALKTIDLQTTDVPSAYLNDVASSRFDKLNRIKHPSLVHYQAIELKHKEVSILTDLSKEGTLLQLISSSGRLSEDVVACYTKQMLEGLFQLHRNGFTHSDLKPTNVLIFENSNVKLSDYSIADIYDSRLRQERNDKKKLDHIKLNNIPYMAPEVVKNLGVTPLSDVWSLGCLVVYMLTGKRPWTQLGSRDEMFKKVTRASVPPLPFGVTVACEHFLESCLSVIPSQRSTVEQLLDHPFITGVKNFELPSPQQKKGAIQNIQDVQLETKQITLKKQKSVRPKRFKTQINEDKTEHQDQLKPDKVNNLTDRLRTQQVPIVESKEIQLSESPLRNEKKKSNLLLKPAAVSNNPGHYVMLNNKKVKIKHQLYRNRRQTVQSTEETEWTSPERIRIKLAKQYRRSETKNDSYLKFEPSLGIHSGFSRYDLQEQQQENRLRILTEPSECSREEYFKRPLKLIKKKIQKRREEALFEEKLSNATRNYSVFEQYEKLHSEKKEDHEENSSVMGPSRLKNHEQLVIDTEVARAQRSKYIEVRRQTQKFRELHRLKWQFQLNEGKELLKKEVPFSFYMQ